MPKKSKKSKGSDLVLSSYLINCMTQKTPFRLPEGDGREYAVYGPMQVNGDEFPFHLYAVSAEVPGQRQETRIAVDPFRKANGKPRKNINRNPVLAVMTVVKVSTESGGHTASVEIRNVDWIPAAFPDPEA
ncbi:MAG: hypothetical protein WA194_06245 [Patescibacteria group bacterium]